MRTWTWEQVKKIRADDKARDDVERYDQITKGLGGEITDAVDDVLCVVLLPAGECDCGDYSGEHVTGDPTGVFRDRSHLTVTDCCEVPRFVCETGTVLDGAGAPDVTACKARMGCDA